MTATIVKYKTTGRRGPGGRWRIENDILRETWGEAVAQVQSQETQSRSTNKAN